MLPGPLTSRSRGKLSPRPAGRRHLLFRPLSAATPAGLRSAARREARRLTARVLGAPELSSKALEADYRLVALGDTEESLASQLAAFGCGSLPPGLVVGRRPSAGAPRIAFLFTGLGSEHPEMGRDLFAHSVVFRRELERCDAIYRRVTGAPLLVSSAPPFGDAEALASTAYAQPALFAFEYALTQVWREAGVEPAALIGYSLGEDVAACVAGVASLDELLEFVIVRARRTEQLSEPGAMLAVFASARRVEALIAARRGLAIAAVNGPENTIVAGEVAAIDALAADLPHYRVRGRRVPTSHAFHSPVMDPLMEDIEAAVSRIRLHAPRLPLVSSISGRWVGKMEIARPRYWSRRVRETVRFSDGLELLGHAGLSLLVEIGPHPTLLSIANRCLPVESFAGVASLRRDDDDLAVMTAALAEVFVRGVNVWMPGMNGGARPMAAEGGR
jgi:acyl transferase domain-containing protein